MALAVDCLGRIVFASLRPHSVDFYFLSNYMQIFRSRCVWMCESPWVYFDGIRSRKATSYAACTSNNNIKALLSILLFLTLRKSHKSLWKSTLYGVAGCWKTLQDSLLHLKFHQEKSTYSILFLVRLCSCLLSFDTLYKIPELSGCACEDDSDQGPLWHVLQRAWGADPRGAGQMLCAEICQCCKGRRAKGGEYVQVAPRTWT